MPPQYKLALSAISIVFIQTIASAQTVPTFTGRWVLNLEKSKLEDIEKDFMGSLFIIDQEGAQFKLTRYHYFGGKKNKISFKMTADGRTRRVKILFKGKLESMGDSLRASLWRNGFSNVVVYKFGANQNELIADEVFVGVPKDHHNIWLFDRKVNPIQSR